MSRGQWLAFGSLIAVAGCRAEDGATAIDAGDASPVPAVDGSFSDVSAADAAEDSTTDISKDGAAEAAVDDGATPDARVADSAPDAPLADSGLDATDAFGKCSNAVFQCGNAACNGATNYCYLSLPDYHECDDMDGSSIPVQCRSCPTCECYQAYAPAHRCSCTEMDGGLGIGCGACYGAPPARLERLAKLPFVRRNAALKKALAQHSNMPGDVKRS
jgi:hypothetical protein